MISYDDFLKVDIRVGKIIEAKPFPEARVPAYQLKIDFGPEIGVKVSSAQITYSYEIKELPGKNILAVVNFPEKQIGKFMSEVLVLGVPLDDGRVPLLTVAEEVPLGKRIF